MDDREARAVRTAGGKRSGKTGMGLFLGFYGVGVEKMAPWSLSSSKPDCSILNPYL